MPKFIGRGSRFGIVGLGQQDNKNLKSAIQSHRGKNKFIGEGNDTAEIEKKYTTSVANNHL